MISEVSRGVRGYWLCGPPAAAATAADSRRRALREVDKSQWTIPKVQACEQFIQAQAYSLEPDDPPESPALVKLDGTLFLLNSLLVWRELILFRIATEGYIIWFCRLK